MGNQKFTVRIRKDCERYDFYLGRRILEVFEEHEFNSIDECVSFIDSLLKSREFVNKYYAYHLKLEIVEDYGVKYFVTIHLGWNKEVKFLFSSDESLIPLKEDYYHKAQETSIWGPSPEW